MITWIKVKGHAGQGQPKGNNIGRWTRINVKLLFFAGTSQYQGVLIQGVIEQGPSIQCNLSGSYNSVQDENSFDSKVASHEGDTGERLQVRDHHVSKSNNSDR